MFFPFAYPPGTMTPEVEFAEKQDMINPYVPQSKDAKPTSVKTASMESSKVQVVINPFVKAGGSSIAAK